MAEGKPISGGTAVSVSVAVSLVIAGVQWGASGARSDAMAERVGKLEVRVDSGATAQQSQAVEIAAMKEAVKAIRDSAERIERAVEDLRPPARAVQRGTP